MDREMLLADFAALALRAGGGLAPYQRAAIKRAGEPRVTIEPAQPSNRKALLLEKALRRQARWSR